MDCLAQLLILPGAIVPGGQNVGADGKTKEQVGQQVDQGRVGAHRRQGIVSGIAAHDYHVRRVEQQLEHGGKGQGYRETQQLWQDGTIAHVDLITFFRTPGHEIPPKTQYIVKKLSKKMQNIRAASGQCTYFNTALLEKPQLF